MPRLAPRLVALFACLFGGGAEAGIADLVRPVVVPSDCGFFDLEPVKPGFTRLYELDSDRHLVELPGEGASHFFLLRVRGNEIEASRLPGRTEVEEALVDAHPVVAAAEFDLRIFDTSPESGFLRTVAPESTRVWSRAFFDPLERMRTVPPAASWRVATRSVTFVPGSGRFEVQRTLGFFGPVLAATATTALAANLGGHPDEHVVVAAELTLAASMALSLALYTKTPLRPDRVANLVRRIRRLRPYDYLFAVGTGATVASTTAVGCVLALLRYWSH